MSGTPSKMLEHLLDTRLNIQVGPNDDSFLDDFLLTHIVFMPIAQLVVSFCIFDITKILRYVTKRTFLDLGVVRRELNLF